MIVATRPPACLGGEPLFRNALHVGRPNVGSHADVLEMWSAMLDRKWFSNGGPLVVEFERKLASLLNVEYCIAVVNATAGLELLGHALSLSGDVLMPAFTFVATAHAMRWLGLRPVFVDIDPLTHTIDPVLVAQQVTHKVSAIIPVHVWGRPCDTDALGSIAASNGTVLIYDAAHAFACSTNGRMIGCNGSAEVFSFHATKFFNTLEGGAIATNDANLARELRLARNFGFEGYDNVMSLGVNAKMNEASAAMGLVNLEALDGFIECNRNNYYSYHKAFADVPGLRLIAYDESEKNNYQYVIAELEEEVFGLSRDMLVHLLHAENVLVRRYFYPGCHRMPPYSKENADDPRNLPHTDRLSSRVLSFPTGTSVGAKEIEIIGEFLVSVARRAEEIKDALGRIGR